MYRLLSFLSSFAILHAALAVHTRCRWKDNSTAVGYLPCNPSSTRGSCCLEGETCLASGLCYGAVGLVYRGACNNEWDSISCITYCDDKSKDWANLYPCAPKSGGSLPPVGWWCGNASEQACSDKGTTLKINPGLPQRVLGLANDLNASSSSSSTSDSSQTPLSTSTSSPPGGARDGREDPATTLNKALIIGLIIGLVVLLVIVVVGALRWVRFQKRESTKFENVGGVTVTEYRQEMEARKSWATSPQGRGGMPEMDVAKRRMELDGQRGVIELEGTHTHFI